jgi:hypothetical protein
MNRGFGGGRGGRGGGRGRRNMFYATGLAGWQRETAGLAAAGLAAAGTAATTAAAAQAESREQELETLKKRADDAAATLQQIRKRIDELQQPAES